MSSINDCSKFEDNRSKQSGLIAHTSFTNGGGHLGNKMADAIFFFFSEAVPLTLNEHRKPEDDILNCFAVIKKK